MQLKLGARYAVRDPVGHVVVVANPEDASTVDASNIM
jgi:hypothetical protein